MPPRAVPEGADVDLRSNGLAPEAPPDGPHERPVHFQEPVTVHFLGLVQHHPHLRVHENEPTQRGHGYVLPRRHITLYIRRAQTLKMT